MADRLNTLCIAELQDGRRALVHIDRDAERGHLVLILRDEDLIPPSMRVIPSKPVPVIDPHTGEVMGNFTSAQTLGIPQRPATPRITADDLIQRGAQLAPGAPLTPEDQLLKDILDLSGDDPEAPSHV